MHLTQEIFDNIDSFMERADYVSKTTDEKDFNRAYSPKYSFFPERMDEEAQGYNALCKASYFEELAAKCICNYNFFKRIFHRKDNSIKPCHVYELAYHSYLHCKLATVYIPLSIVCANIINGVSFNRIPSEELDCDEAIMSEWAISDILFSLDARTACRIISKCNIESSQIAELKKYIIRKDYEGFVSYIIENNVNTFHLQMACTLTKLGKQYEQELNIEDFSVEEWEKSVVEKLENPEIELPTGLATFYTDLLHHPKNLAIENFVSYIFTMEIQRVQLVKHLKYYSTAIDAVVEFDRILEEHPEMDDSRLSYDDLLNNNIYCVRFPMLEDFKQRFVCETNYPPSVGKPKEPKSCYRYNEDKCKWKEDAILHLYNLLVNHGFIEWSEETLYSFMYRMCPEYKPERSDPSPIVWNGKINTLWTVIYHFHGGTIKMDDLTRLFFLKKNGDTFTKNDGGKNSTRSKDPKIMEILQDPMFAKS